MSLPKMAWAAFIALASIGVALACGPDFPWQLFDNRAEAVTEPIGLGFESEAKRLAPAPRDKLVAVEHDQQGPDPEVVAAERQEASSGAWKSLVGLAPQLLADKLAAARDAADGEAALTAGASLPAAVATYIAGAIEFRAGHLDAAAKYFEAIERLPPGERSVRAVAAAYMLGRVREKMGDAEPARKAFQASRTAAERGAPDPMGLAVASLGEEARVDLVAAGLTTLDPSSTSLPVQIDDATAARLIGNAVRLYAEQAARGSKTALLSLREVASLLMEKPDRMGAAVASPIVRRLLVTYVIARDGQSIWGDGPSSGNDVQAVIDAVLTQPVPAAGEDVDRLAALAYQTAHYDVAEKLAAQASRPLGLWVRAKLALRRGDRAAAVRDWTAALTAIDGAAGDLDQAAAVRLRGETAVMQLAQGNYQESMRLLFPVAQTYWGDVAYIAERVLTVDELKAFVDAMPPAAPARKSDDGFFGDPTEGLRTLLGRRLIREGRNAEAVAYFPTTAPKSVTNPPEKTHPLADDARDYVAAVAAAQPTSWWRNVTRAEALFNLSTITRDRGMEVMGTEGPPDEAALDGEFSGGVGQSSVVGDYTTDPEQIKANLALLGPDEKDRFAASAAKPDVRFHYRVLATDRAIAAADLLPQRSQAYAATLCWAALFARDSNDLKRVTAIYKRYVATGAYQPWARTFGDTCPEPDFGGARHFWFRRIAAWPAKALRGAARHPGEALGAGLVAMLLLAGLAWGIRLRRRPIG